MSEQNQRQVVVKAMKELDAQSVENLCSSGVPDIEFIGGWIETKVIADWPKRADTVVRIPHYTPQQRVWAIKRASKGGKVWMLILVERTQEWVLLPGEVAAKLISSEGKTIKGGTQSTIREKATAVWQGNAELKENIIACLRP